MLYRMNRRLYWFLVNFFKISGFIFGMLAAMLAAIFGLVTIATYFHDKYGSTIPFFLLLVVCAIAVISWYASKIDTDLEKSKQDKVENTLKKDWYDV